MSSEIADAGTMTTAGPTRRALLGGAMLVPLLALPGCASMPGFSLTEAIRRLLSLSSQRAFAMLVAPGGFYDSQVARIDLPPQLGGSGASGLVSRVLAAPAFKERLTRQINHAAERGAERAAPLVAEAITTISIPDALAVVRGGPQAASDLLEQAMGRQLIGAMFPAIESGLRLADNAVVVEALKLASGIDLAGLVNDVSTRAHDAIYAAIGAEEAAIRANPGATGDPLLMSVFGVLRQS